MKFVRRLKFYSPGSGFPPDFGPDFATKLHTPDTKHKIKLEQQDLDSTHQELFTDNLNTFIALILAEK